MKKIFYFLLFQIIVLGQLFAQSEQTVSVVSNYKGWQWDSVFVARNAYISVAVVPQAGGRVLEYNLGDVPSLWINPNMMGKSFAPNDEVKRDEWRNFGGYRLVPLPVDNCSIDENGDKIRRWPPPAIIGDSPYAAEIGINSEGQQTIDVCSGIQNLPVPSYSLKTGQFIYPEHIEEQLQYKRSLSIEEGSSLVHIRHTLINRGSETVKRGIMISSQHIARSKPELEDGENFRAYIPFSADLKLPSGEQYEVMGTADTRWQFVNKNRMALDKNNPEHVKRFYNNGTNWMGETAPGIFEIHYDYYLMSGFHIISSKSWICYVNKITNTAFAKMFEPYDPTLEYDHGLNMSIYNSGLETGYLETEVKTPLHTLKPGERFDYKEVHGAAQVLSTPILDVNETGIVTQYLNFDQDTKVVSGEYGFFREGIAVLRLRDKSNHIIEEILLEEVNPLKGYSLFREIRNNACTKFELVVKDKQGREGILDSLTW